MTDLSGNTFFDGPSGLIEAILKEPTTLVTRVAIACHPHPRFGGTMHNKVVFRIARTFQDAGFAVLRFNFRGTGRSEGVHDNGIGEQSDLYAAIEFVQRRYPVTEVWLAGFSFGAAVMLRGAACDNRVRAFIAAGVPLSKYDFPDLEHCKKPKLFVQGSSDQFGSVQDLERLFAVLNEPKELQIIVGADHFFEGRLTDLQAAISRFIDSVDTNQQL